MWTDGNGFLYEGDCRAGDRTATKNEVSEYLASIMPSKQELLASITVTTQSGKTFDGNETARGDMMAALAAGELLGETETNWKMANGDKLLVTRDELREALTLAIQAKGRIIGAIE